MLELKVRVGDRVRVEVTLMEKPHTKTHRCVFGTGVPLWGHVCFPLVCSHVFSSMGTHVFPPYGVTCVSPYMATCVLLYGVTCVFSYGFTCVIYYGVTCVFPIGSHVFSL